MQRSDNKSDNKFPIAIEKWLAMVRTDTGYMPCFTGGGDHEGDDDENSKMWEFRIQVLPTCENLIMASCALAEVFSKPENHHIDFKCLAINSEKEFSMPLWDGTLTEGRSD